jgi:ribosomal protein L11 methyltransferase
LIVANILAKPLCQLSKDLKRHLSKDGTVILSGLLQAQETMVLSAHRRQGLRLVNRQRRKGWSTLTLAARR